MTLGWVVNGRRRHAGQQEDLILHGQSTKMSFSTRIVKYTNSEIERRRPLRVVYGASHHAGQLGETGPPRPSEIGTTLYVVQSNSWSIQLLYLSI
jgi:hypothetical protein